MGSTNRRADRELIEELRRFTRGESFDEQAMPVLDSEALDFRAASECFARVRKLTRRDLRTLRMLTDHQGRTVPTVGGLLLFGRERTEHFPDAWVQAGRFGGPCCGSSGMFVQSVEFLRAHANGNGNGGKAKADISIYGQESNCTTWRRRASRASFSPTARCHPTSPARARSAGT